MSVEAPKEIANQSVSNAEVLPLPNNPDGGGTLEPCLTSRRISDELDLDELMNGGFSHNASTSSKKEFVVTPLDTEEIRDSMLSMGKDSTGKMSANPNSLLVSSTGGSETNLHQPLSRDIDKQLETPIKEDITTNKPKGPSPLRQEIWPPTQNAQIQESEESVESVDSEIEMMAQPTVKKLPTTFQSTSKVLQRSKSTTRSADLIEQQAEQYVQRLTRKKPVEEIPAESLVQVLTDIEDIEDVVEPAPITKLNTSGKRIVNVAKLIDASKKWSRNGVAKNAIDLDLANSERASPDASHRPVAKNHPLIRPTSSTKVTVTATVVSEEEKALREACQSLKERISEQDLELGSLRQKLKTIAGEVTKHKHDKEMAGHELETATKENKSLSQKCRELAEDKAGLILKNDGLEMQIRDLSSLLVTSKEQISNLKYQLSLCDRIYTKGRLLKHEEFAGEYEEASTTSIRAISSSRFGARILEEQAESSNFKNVAKFESKLKIFSDNSQEKEITSDINDFLVEELPDGFERNAPHHKVRKPARSCLKLPKVGPKGNLISGSPTKPRKPDLKVHFNPDMQIFSFEYEKPQVEGQLETTEVGVIAVPERELTLEEIVEHETSDLMLEVQAPILLHASPSPKIFPPTPAKPKKKRTLQKQKEKEMSRVLSEEFRSPTERNDSDDSEGELEETLQRKLGHEYLGKRKKIFK